MIRRDRKEKGGEGKNGKGENREEGVKEGLRIGIESVIRGHRDLNLVG